MTAHPETDAEICEFLPWDSGHFGLRIGRVLTRRLDAVATAGVLRWASAEDIVCLFLLADAGHPETLRLAAAHGFRFVDVRLTLGVELRDRPKPLPATGVTIRVARAEDESALSALAAVNHTDSRFFTDGRFDARALHAMFASWMQGSLEGALADLVLVADFRGRPAGYITVTLDHESRAGTIRLFGVEAAARGAGVGGALIAAVLEHLRRADLPSAYVVTQGRNVGAQRTYQRSGFRTLTVEIWFHRWRDEVRDGGRRR